MAELVRDVDFLNLVAFAALAVVALRQWARRRDKAALWCAVAFVTIGAVVVAGRLLPEDPDTTPGEIARRILIVALLLFPYFLYRFTTELVRPTQRLERFLGLMTIALVVWTFVLPEIPADDEPRSAAFTAYIVGFMGHWAILSVTVTIRLWRAGRGQPTVARRRMQMLSVASASMTVALVIAAGSPAEDVSPTQLAASLAAMAAALLFLAGLAPPAILRTYWRRPEQDQLRVAVDQLMAANAEEEVVERVLAPMTRIVGARGVTLLDANGMQVGSYGNTDVDDRGETVRVAAASGALLVHTTPYAPFFGEEELGLLRTLVSLTGLALDRTRLFTQEREAREALERADELKSNFVALAAHELRTPVAAIHGFVETLHTRRDQLSDDQREQLEQTLRQQTERMRWLVEQLLDLSRLDAEAVEIHPQRVSVRERVEELVAAAAAGARPGEIEVDVPADLEVDVDPTAFDRVLTNLVTNALRYGSSPITVRAERNDRHFRLTVEDRGPGVPPDFVPSLFERFSRSERSRSRVTGTGLGLAIARSYAQAHRGDLLYEPAQPHGSRFQLVLPATAGDFAAHMRAARPR